MSVPIALMAGLDRERLCLAISNSRRLLLHAAIYNNFAHEPFASAFLLALARPDFDKLTILSHHSQAPWQHEFGQILRQGWSQSALTEAYQHSDQWLRQLSSHSDKVTCYHTSGLPLAPILLIDEQIWVGHYAHSAEPAGKGVWLQFDCQAFGVSVETLWQWAQHQAVPTEATPWQCVLFRYVSECYHSQISSTKE